MADFSSHDETHTPQMTAGYIADMTRDLARMARASGLQTLGYILDMARIEAEASRGGETQGCGRANGAPPR
ncbi:hypothetical protein GJ689_05670 [Rhodoplanes serenus]|jgi:Mrp family chromosome partitioning ATPase|uniref:Uncharacterized protein n=1 Tax=Rhodoplanes serenus TaxID=200615 RepID=A0A327K720_9BRAD|nr:hypothetical protein [Rhodoplanes serenus]MBI5114267.1 hypothetical protein [Rhodovulum sp.]MTW15692.1 hypothetical protein [Rhodoplanes serenus]RAI34187.1 hypothetical protein CH340_09860 [Rhodoplanes serenus]VCU07030.1 hypothetical protein RHODGE_RHODGE_00120 [Rhodoplanes serenus]